MIINFTCVPKQTKNALGRFVISLKKCIADKKDAQYNTATEEDTHYLVATTILESVLYVYYKTEQIELL